MMTAPKTTGGTLVIQPLPGIGDVIWHLPHMRAIAERTRDGKITLLTKPRSLAREVLAGADFVREVLYLDSDGGRHSGPLGGFRLGDDLKPHAFEEAWILHMSSRYALAAWRGGIAERIGYGIGWQDAFLTSPHGLSRRERSLSAVEKANRLFALHDNPVAGRNPKLDLTKDALDAARARLGEAPGALIGIVIGASESFKQWGEVNFAELITRLREKNAPGIVLLGGPGDEEIERGLRARLGNPNWIASAVEEPILTAAAMASMCRLCIGNDSGLLNIAGAVGTPSIGLFGGSRPVTQDDRITIVAPEGVLRYGKNRMAEISVEMVLGSIPPVE